MKKDIFKLSGQVLKSRLIVGTGKYKSFKETAKAVKASGAKYGYSGGTTSKYFR